MLLGCYNVVVAVLDFVFLFTMFALYAFLRNSKFILFCSIIRRFGGSIAESSIFSRVVY